MSLVGENGQPLAVDTKRRFIFHVQPHRDLEGHEVREIVADVGERPEAMGRFYGILIATQQDPRTGATRHQEVEFPIPALTLEHAFDQFEELAKAKVAELQRQVIPVDGSALRKLAGPAGFRPPG